MTQNAMELAWKNALDEKAKEALNFKKKKGVSKDDEDDEEEDEDDEEELSESGKPSINVRSAYAKTYAMNTKTVHDSKKAEELAYVSIGKKFGDKAMQQLKAYHKKNEEELSEGNSVLDISNLLEAESSLKNMVNIADEKARTGTVSLEKVIDGLASNPAWDAKKLMILRADMNAGKQRKIVSGKRFIILSPIAKFKGKY